VEKTRGNAAIASAFHDPSSKECTQSNSMQTLALKHLDKKYCKIFLCAKMSRLQGGTGAPRYTQIKCSIFPTEKIKVNVL